MRFTAPIALLTFALTATPALAGTVSYAEGQGSWRPTSCHAPQALSVVAHDSEAAADDLNAQMTKHKAFADASEDYMKCISAEAARDSEAASKLIVRDAEAEIKKAHDAVATEADDLERQRAEFIHGNRVTKRR